MKQGILNRTQDNIRGLSELKKNGHKIGKLKYKSMVRGLKQIPAGSDIANGTLLCKHGDYYLSITTYQEKKKQANPVESVGVDFGLNRQLLLSNGTAIQYAIPVSTKHRALARKLSKQQLHSKNWNKTRIKMDKEYEKVMDRDHNSSINIENEGLRKIGTVRTELTPVEIESSTLISLRYLNSIPYVKASSVYEPGSLTALA